MFWTLLRKLRRLGRRLWIKVFLISMLGFVAIGMAKVFGQFIPDGAADVIGAKALDRLLGIISTSMLTVTTFSLTVMVTLHRAVSQQWTPRAHRILLEDTTTQTVLATFVGAYIFALTSIIMLSTPFYGEKEIVALYLMTIVVLTLIVWMILRWILKLQSLGSLLDTTARIEEVTTRVFRAQQMSPCLGGHPWRGNAPPDGAVPVRSTETAYVQAIYQDSLQRIAERADILCHVEAPVGRFVHRGDVLMWCTSLNDDLENEIKGCVHLGALRSAEQDPRFGLIQLSEIGSKALSPGINDPGTAIDVLGRLTRILLMPPETDSIKSIQYNRLWFRALDPYDLLVDAFAAIARDGDDLVEVQIALQKNLAAIVRHADLSLSSAAFDIARSAYTRAMSNLSDDSDKMRLTSETPAAVIEGSADRRIKE